VAVPLGSVRGSRRALRGANWGYTCDGCGNFAKVLSRLPWLCVAGCRHRGTRSGHGDGCMIYRRTRRGLGLRREGVPNRARWCLRAAVRGGIGRGSGRRRTRSGMVPPVVADGHAGGPMGGTGRRSNIDPASDFCSETARALDGRYPAPSNLARTLGELCKWILGRLCLLRR